MFMWMFIEGLYLHNVVTVTVFQGRFPHTMYALVGWGAPFVLTVIWAVITIKYKVNQKYVQLSLDSLVSLFWRFSTKSNSTSTSPLFLPLLDVFGDTT